MRNAELLDEILQLSEYQYISDLNGEIIVPSVKNALKEIIKKDGRYTEREWEKAIYYISGGKAEFNTMDEVREYIAKL